MSTQTACEERGGLVQPDLVYCISFSTQSQCKPKATHAHNIGGQMALQSPAQQRSFGENMFRFCRLGSTTLMRIRRSFLCLAALSMVLCSSVRAEDAPPRPKPRSVTVFWKQAWTKAECEQKKRKFCVPPGRYRVATPEERAHYSWHLAVKTAGYLLDKTPDFGQFIPFKAGSRRYVAYITPHEYTFRDTNGDGKREKIKLDEPVRGVNVYIRRVQPKKR